MSERASRLVWIELEATGLDPASATIRAIATIVTDDQLKIVARGPALMIDELTPIAEAERATLEFLREQVDPRTAPLCGDTVWRYKQLLERWLPSVVAHLHYRVVDVATIKELARRWYDLPFASAPEAGASGASGRVERSIAELERYRSEVFVAPVPR